MLGDNSIGKEFVTICFGESHGKCVGVTIDGCPAGLPLHEKDLQKELDKRIPSQPEIVSARREKDIVEIGSLFESLAGKLYTKNNKSECPINFNPKYSGDLFFIANEGYQVYPNFFDVGEVKAMHGYDKTKELDALLVSNKKITRRNRINNIDICPLILKMMGLKKPSRKNCIRNRYFNIL